MAQPRPIHTEYFKGPALKPVKRGRATTVDRAVLAAVRTITTQSQGRKPYWAVRITNHNGVEKCSVVSFRYRITAEFTRRIK
jgi:hypothetical protein